MKHTGRAAAFAAALGLAWTMLPLPALGEDTGAEGLTYEVTENEVTITGCDTSLAALDIPETIEGLPVTQIANTAFMRSAASSITLPDSIERIGAGAFWHCQSLTEITVPEGVERLESNLFNDCTSLADIRLPEDLQYIGRNVFTDTPWLAARREEDPFVIVDGILADAAAAVVSPENPGIDPVEIVLPDGIWGIAEQVFGSDGYMVTSVYIPDGVTMIAKEAFYRYRIIEEFRVPDTLTEIGENAFTDTKWFNARKEESDYLIISGILLGTDLTESSVEIPEGVWQISSRVFLERSDITQVTFPESLRVIGSKAFLDCTGLTELELPEGLEVIGEDAFSGCTGLTELTLPRHMQRLEKGAFLNCDNLTGARICARELTFGENALGCKAQLLATGQYAYLVNTTVNHDFLIECLEGTPAEAYAQTMEMQKRYFRLFPLGDPDGSGRVNANDAARVLVAAARIGAKRTSGLDTDEWIAADVNEDSHVNAVDASCILRYSAAVGATRIPADTPMEAFLHPAT
ncbi:MAG: leucine-rich repeat protein [Oscillospiraceae bacterium]|nr:leucine-rich repeat protein [Oscillospiraceae bacterium]